MNIFIYSRTYKYTLTRVLGWVIHHQNIFIWKEILVV